MAKCVGIDTGSKGCFVMLDTIEKTASYLNIPYRKDGIINGTAIAKAFDAFMDVSRIYIEEVKGRGFTPNCSTAVNWGAKQTLTMGKNYGMVLGTMQYLPMVIVQPKTWQKNAHKGIKAPTAKEKTLAAFDRLNPSYGGIAKSENGMADAFFIARHALDELGIQYSDDWNFINLGD